MSSLSSNTNIKDIFIDYGLKDFPLLAAQTGYVLSFPDGSSFPVSCITEILPDANTGSTDYGFYPTLIEVTEDLRKFLKLDKDLPVADLHTYIGGDIPSGGVVEVGFEESVDSFIDFVTELGETEAQEGQVYEKLLWGDSSASYSELFLGLAKKAPPKSKIVLVCSKAFFMSVPLECVNRFSWVEIDEKAGHIATDDMPFYNLAIIVPEVESTFKSDPTGIYKKLRAELTIKAILNKLTFVCYCIEDLSNAF